LLNRKVILNTWVDRLAKYVPINTLLQYLFAAIVLFVFYRQVIRPFAIRMLEELKEEEEDIQLELDKDEELEEDLSEKYAAMRKNVELSLGLHEGISEEDIKYDLLVEEISKYISEHTDEVSNLFQLLIEEETNLGNKNQEGSDGRGGRR